MEEGKYLSVFLITKRSTLEGHEWNFKAIHNC